MPGSFLTVTTGGSISARSRSGHARGSGRIGSDRMGTGRGLERTMGEATRTGTQQRLEGHGGALAVAAARRHGVSAMFTLSGGHVFPLYDGAVKADPPLPLVDVRHEQTAVFAAEGMAKLTRAPGLAVVTAGPGVTNSVSAVTTAWFNGSPLLVLGGRAPAARWGSGSLQELDHPPLLAPVTKRAATVHRVGDVAAEVDAALRLAETAHRGPVFLDVPVEQLFSTATATLPPAQPPPVREPDADALAGVAALLAGAERPVLVLGSDVWADRAEVPARRAAEALGLPVIANGLGRGVLPRGHELLVTRARSLALGAADLVVVAGAPLDFRLGYGAFGGQGGPPANVVHLADSPGQLATHAPLAGAVAGDLGLVLDGLTAAAERDGRRPGRAGRPGAAVERRRPRSPGQDLRGAPQAARRRRRGDRRRRRLRLVRRPLHRALPAGLVAGPRPLRLPRHRPGLRGRRPHGPPGRAGRAAARRRRGGPVADGRGHAGPPRLAGGDGVRQQRRLGAREAPDAQAVRLRRGGRAAARLPLRRGGAGARRRRRAGHHPGRHRPGAPPRLRRRRPLPGQRPHRPGGRLPPGHHRTVRRPVR